uniref:ubiquitinyl hydrolase 1 n=1 Tax=Syphacia muris TaxID=451379 RepID=A0A158R535_9BILA
MEGISLVTRSRNNRRKNVSDVTILDDLNYETAFKLYQLDKDPCTLHSIPNPKTQNCRYNAYCLGRLGQQRWDKEKQQIDREGKATAKCFARRDVTKVPCGLINLGNSCYLNSFIQIYFSDPFFRRLIYSWHPVNNFIVPVGEKVNIEELMLCLQRLFVTLQVTPYEDANAEHLAKLLQLDSEQHDALEFQILLFNKIEKLLSSREEWREVKDAIVNRGKGIITQRITCSCGRESVCDVPFHPFIVGIEKVNTLSKALEIYFSPEHLPGYVCPTCHVSDLTVRKFTIKQPPPVVTIQVNRFTLDAAGRKKKVRSALQYLREIELGGILYENCAVMVHEGPDADCGHYYDIIKHPDTGKWFTYNDEVVKPTTPPGVVSEKERISKTTLDMKGCYALIYRRKNETNDGVPEPPQHLKEEITAMVLFDTLDAEFLAQKMEANGSSKKSYDLMEERRKFLSDLWEKLQVKRWQDVMDEPESVVFIPTQLLIDIQAKEFDAFMKLRNESTTEVKKLQVDAKIKDNTAGINDFPTELAFSPVSFELCEHGRISLDSICRGELKAVLREGALYLMEHYCFQVASDDGSPLNLKNARDICLECVRKKKAEFKFMELVDYKEKIAKALLREKTQRFYHADNCLWVSTRSLMQYRKLATRAYNQRCKSLPRNRKVFFTFSSQVSSKDADETKILFGDGAKKDRNHCDITPSTSSVIEDSSNSKSEIDRGNVIESEDQIKSDLEEKVVEEVMDQTEGISTANCSSPECVVGDTDIEVDNDKANVVTRTDEVPFYGATSNDSNGDNSEFVQMVDGGSKLRNEEDDASDEAVIFNGDLRCPHGKFDYKCYETKERRIVVEVWEWNSLVDDIFSPSQTYKVITDEYPCPICKENFKNKVNNNEDQQRRLQELRSSVGELIRNISRRNSYQVTDDNYTRIICADFIRNMIARFKSGARNVTIPRLCQQCLLCEDHKLPYLFFDVERKALPLTSDEWERIVNAMKMKGIEAQEIVVQNGNYEVFCEPCRKVQQEIDDHKRFVYEKGADIYVKLKSDENDEPKGENGIISLTVQSDVRLPPATRRTVAKNCMKFKMTSMNTISELKVKIYEKTGQTPNDQLLYYNDRLLYETDTFESARIDPKELIEAPLILITQSVAESFDVPRTLEKGFANTALSHW